MLEKAIQVSVVSDDLSVDSFLNDSVKCLSVCLPFLGGANDLGSLPRRDRLNLLGGSSVLFCGRMLFEFVLRIESPCKQVGCRHGRQFLICEKDHGDKKFLGAVQLLGPRSTLTTSLERARHLSEMQHAEICFRMTKRIARKGAGHGFRAGHSKVVNVIGIRCVREISINHTSGEIGAIPGKSIKMILI